MKKKNNALALREGEGGRSPNDALVLPGQDRSLVNIKDAPQRAEKFLDTTTHALKEGSAIVPVGDRILVRRIPDAVNTAGSIVLPEIGRTKAGYGVVVAAGQGRFNLAGQLIPLRVQAGAIVCFGKYAGTDVNVLGVHNEDGACVIIREEEVFYVVMGTESAARIAANADPRVSTYPSVV